MDTQKDIQIRAEIDKIFDTPESHADPFGANQFGIRLYRRMERIAAGVLLATNHIDTAEPLQSTARATALECLTQVMRMRSTLRAENSPEATKMLALLRSLTSHMRMLAVAGLVSLQNVTILAEAIDGLALLVVSAGQSSLAEEVPLSRADFMSAAIQKDIKDSNRTLKIGREMSNNIGTDASSSSNVSDIRRGNIISILRRTGTMGIADISSSLPEYSRKMVQRDLAELVKEGKVSKAGSKRWSLYSLPS